MKVLTAMYTMRRGGAYDRFRMMLEALLERGCKVHCLSLTPIPMNDRGYQNHVLRIPTGLQKSLIVKMVVLFFFPLCALWIGRQEKVDLFIAFGAIYAFIESIPKWILRKPMVTFLRGSSAFGMETQGRSAIALWVTQWIEKVGIQYSDIILSVNSTLQEETRRMIRNKRNVRWEILPNNIPPIPKPDSQDIFQIRKKHGIPDGAKVLVTAGIINRGKNIELLLESLHQVIVTHNNIYLLILGDASMEADFHYLSFLKEMAKSLGINDRVGFAGWVEKEELWKIFHGADLFILPSKSEGMPNVLLEALGCDLPCLGSDIPGTKDILKYEDLMFDPSNAMEVSEKIRLLFKENSFLTKAKQLCEERKEAFIFNWKEKVLEMIKSEYEKA